MSKIICWTVTILSALATLTVQAAVVGQEAQDAKTVNELKSYLKQYPAADANGDGQFTVAERDVHRRQLVLSNFPDGATNFMVMMPMRDGVKLATEVFLPPGTGAWPVVLIRSGYDRWSAAIRDAPLVKGEALALVTQDIRGDEGSEGKGTRDPFSFDAEINDGYDTIEWIARQPWCNGRVGIQGTSGHGFAAYMAVLANPPHLVVASTINSGGSAHLYWAFHNEVRYNMYDWMCNVSAPAAPWPKPTIQPFDRTRYDAIVRQSALSNTCIILARTGWYDIFSECAPDYMEAFGPGGKVFIKMAPSGHGAMQGRPFPNARSPADVKMPSFQDVLKGNLSKMPAQSAFFYCLMGDAITSNAPGNIWKVAHAWPVPHTPTPFYLQAKGGLSGNPPVETNVCLTYAYCPTNPAPTLGGAMYLSPGPVDQRPLSNRTDILRFATEPLTEPLEITGKVWAELEISSDAADTTFVVHLIDIYPDGYEAIVRDGAMMARYWPGFDKPAPLVKDKIYKLKMDMWSTAYVFNKGHRIGVHVTSSDAPKYEVHPNTYEPVSSYANAPTAHNTVHCSAAHASRIILPVINADTAKQ